MRIPKKETVLEKIKQYTVVEQVMERIRGLIASGEYQAGDQLPTEQALAERFGVGRSSIREAVKTFNYLGVLESKAAKGTYVRDGNSISEEALTWSILLGSSDMLNMVEIRGAIELWSALVLSEKVRQHQESAVQLIEKLRCLTDDMEAAAARGDTDSLVETDYEFHRLIIREGENPLFISLYQTLRAFMLEEIRRTYVSVADLRDLPGSHRAVLDAVLGGSVEKVTHAVQRHIAETKAKLNEYFKTAAGGKTQGEHNESDK